MSKPVESFQWDGGELDNGKTKRRKFIDDFVKKRDVH